MRATRPQLFALALVAASLAVGIPAGAAPVTLGPNLVVNPGFESGLSGWYASSGADLRSGTGRNGQAAVIGSGAQTRTVVLNDQANTVSSTRAGATYRAGAWVRGSGQGVPAAVRVQEWGKDGKQGEQLTYQWLPGTDWTYVEVRYTARTSGASLDLNVVSSGLVAGRSLRVDDVTLAVEQPVRTPSVPPPLSRTPGPGSVAPSMGQQAPSPVQPAPSQPAPVPAAPGAPAGWNLVWADEFNGTSVDRTKWNVENNSTYGDGNKELACLMDRPENVRVADGTLQITARRERTPVVCGSKDMRFPGGRQYTSGHLTTRNKASFTYGRIEMRASTPTQANTSKGLWPAFWLRPTAGGTGEIDVMEAIGSGAGSTEHTKVHQTIHYDYIGTHRKQANTYTLPSGSPSDGMHVYAVEWEPNRIRWYVDGVLTYSRTTQDTSWVSPTFDKEFFLRLNMAVGGTWPGSPDNATAFPATYAVDYVRVYQR